MIGLGWWGKKMTAKREINGTGSEADTTATEVPPADPVEDNLVAFARAIRGEALYPITGEDLINNKAFLKPSSHRLPGMARW